MITRMTFSLKTGPAARADLVTIIRIIRLAFFRLTLRCLRWMKMKWMIRTKMLWVCTIINITINITSIFIITVVSIHITTMISKKQFHIHYRLENRDVRPNE